MATVINTPTREVDSGASAGWAVALVILLAVIAFGLFVWPGYIRPAATTQQQTPGANINVTLPSTDNSGGTGGTQSGLTGGTQSGSTGGTSGGTTQTPAQ